MTVRAHTRLRIGFLSPHNPYDRRAFSGTAFYAAEALRAHPRVNLKILGDHRVPGVMDTVLRRASRKLTDVDPGQAKGLDAVVGLVSSSLVEGLGTDPDQPYLHVTDATPRFLRDAYGWDIPAEAETREARVIARADKVVYSSHEMARRAAREFGIEAAAIPFGINLDGMDLPQMCPVKSPLSKPNLLFIGNDWVRKGGDIAVAALDALRARGVDAHLTIVGRMPHALKDHPHITGMGYLNKNRPADAAMLGRLYEQAHLLVLPSRADCTPMVAAEAMVHGAPVLASDTGGIATLLGGPGTGRLLPLAATGVDWADEIEALLQDDMGYRMMSDAAYDLALTRLTWSAWSADIIDQVDAVRARAADTKRAGMRVIAA